MADVTVVINEGGLDVVARSASFRAAADRVAGQCVVKMKALCPVSPVIAVYAYPVPLGSSRGQAYGGRKIGRGLAVPGGRYVDRTRYPGDLPLRPSGYLRNSIGADRRGEDILIGPHAGYGRYVNDGTRPHEIRSHGPWPLRNRASGQVFGPLVHHPGTVGSHFIERTAAEMDGTRVDA